MTVDYSKKELTFVPSGYKATDIMSDLMKTVMDAMSSKPEPNIAAPAGLWGLELAKGSKDEADGVDVKTVLTGGAAATAPGSRPATESLPSMVAGPTAFPMHSPLPASPNPASR